MFVNATREVSPTVVLSRRRNVLSNKDGCVIPRPPNHPPPKIMGCFLFLFPPQDGRESRQQRVTKLRPQRQRPGTGHVFRSEEG